MVATQHRLTIYGPARYAIRVCGALSAAWSDRFDCLHVVEWNGGKEVVTELVGTLPDQAALLSVLRGLDELDVSLLTVKLLTQPSSYDCAETRRCR